MDPYYKVNSEIHARRPAYGICMSVWTVIMAVIGGFFGYTYFNIESHDQCFVKEGDTKPIMPIPLGVDEMPGVVNVSFNFDLVISLYFMNAATGATLAFYQVMAAFVFPYLLKFS